MMIKIINRLYAYNQELTTNDIHELYLTLLDEYLHRYIELIGCIIFNYI